jgi:hypothetical protein
MTMIIVATLSRQSENREKGLQTACDDNGSLMVNAGKLFFSVLSISSWGFWLTPARK